MPSISPKRPLPLFTTILAVSLVWGAASAQDSSRAQTEELARRAGARLESLHREADRLAGESRSLLGDLRRLEVNRQIAAEELRQITAEASAVSAELAALDKDMRRLESQDRAALPELRRRLVELYKLGRGGYARLLLDTDLRRIAHASRTVAMLAKSDRDRVDARRRRVEELRHARATLEARGTQLAALGTKADRAQVVATQAVRDRNALLRQIDERRDLTAQLAGELQVAQESLRRTLITSGAVPAPDPAVLPLAPFRGDLEWPVSGIVRRRFGAGPAQQPGTTAVSGIEIAAPEGTPVRSVHDGTVVFADVFAGFGNLVILQHDTRNVTMYGHLLEIEVKKGDRVSRGGVVGAAGASPSGETGLYFELRIDAKPVDPLQWLRKR